MTVSSVRGRRIIAALLLPVFGVAATGCGSKGGGASTAAAAPQVRIWRLNQPLDPLRGPLEGFLKANPGVVMTYKNKQIDGYETDALKSMASRNGPDIWSIPNDWLGDESSVIQSMPTDYYYSADGSDKPTASDQVRKLFPPGIAEQLVQPDGTVSGVPTNVDSLELYYNPDLFQAAEREFEASLGNNAKDTVTEPVRALLKSAPLTWNNVIDQTKYLTKTDSSGKIVRSAIALGTADNVPAANEVLQLLMMQNGSRIISTDRTSALFHIPLTTASGVQVNPGAKALEFYVSFATPGKSNYTWNPSLPSALDAFAQGKVAMVVAFGDFGSQLKVKYPRFNFETAAVPQVTTADIQAPVNFIRFKVETVTKTADSTGGAWASIRRYSNIDDTQSLASEQKLRTPYVASLKKNTDDFLNSQILTGMAVYKINRPGFDGAFRQMILDASQNGVSPTDSVNAGAQKVNAILQPPVTPAP